MNTNKANTTPDKKARWEANKAEIERLCTEQEYLYNPDFERVFTALYEFAPDQREVYNTNGWNILADLPEAIDTDTLNRALSATGASDDVRRDFTRYAEVVLQGKRLMQQNALLNMEIEMTNQPQEQQPEGWEFYPINIIAPPDLHNIFAEILEQDAQRGEGLFSNITEIAELPDVALDEFLSVDAYNVVCSLQPYLGVLNRYGVTGQTLGKEYTRYLFAYLKQVADHIKTNTDRPEAIKTYIFEAIKNLDGIKIWGLIFQILTLQGLLFLLDNCTLKEGDNGYNEAQDLWAWIADLLGRKLVWFTYTGSIYGDEDKKRLQPLCEYLYNTEIGRAVQQVIFEPDKSDTPDLNEQSDRPETDTSTPVVTYSVIDTSTAPTPATGGTAPDWWCLLTGVLDTERARKYFGRAIERGWMRPTATGFKWMWGGERGGKAILGYFIEKVYCPTNTEELPESAINNLFAVTRIGSAITQLHTAKKPQRWREKIDEIFDE